MCTYVRTYVCVLVYAPVGSVAPPHLTKNPKATNEIKYTITYARMRRKLLNGKIRPNCRKKNVHSTHAHRPGDPL